MADVDEQLLDTAERLYYARSIQGVGMAELRDESGVPLKRIYQLHPGKEDIVAAWLQRRDAHWREALAEHVERAKDPRKRVLAVFDWLQEQASEPGLQRRRLDQRLRRAGQHLRGRGRGGAPA